MKVVLRSDVTNVGKRGDIIDVADGHARNFLLPRGLAMKATPGVEAQAGAMRRSRDLKDAKDRESAEVVARTLVPAVIRIPARAGGGGRPPRAPPRAPPPPAAPGGGGEVFGLGTAPGGGGASPRPAARRARRP